MPKIKVLSVFGTRPEAYKMIPLVLALRGHPQIESRVCVTAQHRELLDQALAPFGVVPDADLNIMTAGQSLSDVTSRVITGLAPILSEIKPDLLLAHGDTATTFAASLAAFYARVAVGHVEAGLRSYDKYQPYPEEMNRKLTTALADLHFAPTALAREQLLKENVPANKIFVTGNTAIDMIAHATAKDYQFRNDALNQLDFSRRIIVMTAHRKENQGAPMDAIVRAVARLIHDFPDVQLVWPMHPNGAGREPAQAMLAGHERVLLTTPIELHDMHNLMHRAYLVLTDSGGLQEEAPSFNLPVVVLREVTERPEGLTAGTLLLAGADENVIYQETARLLTDAAAYQRMAQAENPFGDGQAGRRIIEAILQEVRPC